VSRYVLMTVSIIARVTHGILRQRPLYYEIRHVNPGDIFFIPQRHLK
jgi:hypothetical protein